MPKGSRQLDQMIWHPPIRRLRLFPSDRRHERRAFTTGVETKLYPAHELEKLYFRRWNVELHFRQIKTNQR
jgi:hypothetical protein